MPRELGEGTEEEKRKRREEALVRERETVDIGEREKRAHAAWVAGGGKGSIEKARARAGREIRAEQAAAQQARLKEEMEREILNKYP